MIPASSGTWTNEQIIIPDLNGKTSSEVIKELGSLLQENGYVRETFVDAVLEREKIFATGLPTPGIQVAIPHADIVHVIQPAIAIGVSQAPIEFGEMGNPEGVVNAQIICMLAVTESETLVSLLQSLVGVFQDQSILQSILQASDKREIASIFNTRLPRA
jgi:PTS system galactitol-specific IIA component